MKDLRDKNVLYLIGEIGINHNGQLEIAKRLIDAVFACGWDCAKFQKRNPDICVPGAQKNLEKDTLWGKMTYLDYKKKIEFERAEYNYIECYCKEKPLDWSCSVWDLDSLEFMQNYTVEFLKIPSAKITDLELVINSAKTGIQLILSTGMSTLEEVDAAVNTILKYGKSPIIMHSNSSYPTPPQELNLNLIPFLQKRYPECIIGYSGHESNLGPTMVAVSLGARIIERHITLSHKMWGTDQKSSLEVHAMDLLRKRLEEVPFMLGSSNKVVTPSEIPIRKKLRGL